MTTIFTDMRETVLSASFVSYEPTSPLTATNVQDAIEQTVAYATSIGTAPPSITPRAVTFAMSPYTPLATDYLLEVNTSGGAVTIQLAAAASRNGKGLDVKDVTGNANTNNISVLRAGAETIDGLTTYLIASPFGANHFQPKTGGYEVL